MTKARRVGLYLRVSTDDQAIENQRRELEAWAKNAGHAIAEVFQDQGVSGTKGWDASPSKDERQRRTPELP